ncbi:MAG: CRISPR-associated endonuclease Cas2 [Patescibacteria group bacterium]|nr:CRISPR-associated endonuclease Cas2 [Patescibacteria group bacterium]
MAKKTKHNSAVLELLDYLFEGAALLPMPLETPYAHMRRLRSWHPGDGPKIIWNLKKSGLVSVSEQNNRKFVKLTKKGELKILMSKAAWQSSGKWDGRWRLIMFDIPEGSRKQRNLLRQLLKRAGFVMLQGSVFVSPHELNRQAVEYLKQTGLIEFVRMMRVDEMDDDRKLRKRFGLK